MSLTELVHAAGNDAVVLQRQEGAARLDELKRRVQEIIPSEVVVQTLSTNPRRAENELRTACQRVFDEDPWFVEGQRDRESIIGELIDGVFGLGPLQDLIDDEEVTEIMVNGCDSIYVERGGFLERCPALFANEDQVRALIDRIIGPLGRRIDEASPMVNARLAQGHRVHAIIPPLALDGPVLTIRKFRARVMTLEEMAQLGSFDQTMLSFLSWAVAARKNIAVSGGTGTGKTTLLNALSCEIGKGERIITIEDSAELRFLEHPHVVRLEARCRNAEGTGEVTIRDLVTNALRMRPDRIVVGECRGGEALDMLQAMNTGHDGSMTTLHANSPADAIMRLTTMVRYTADLPVDVIEAQTAAALDCIVQIARGADGGRFVRDVVEVEYDRERRACLLKDLYRWDDASGAGSWCCPPCWIDDLRYRKIATSEEVQRWLLVSRLSA